MRARFSVRRGSVLRGAANKKRRALLPAQQSFDAADSVQCTELCRLAQLLRVLCARRSPTHRPLQTKRPAVCHGNLCSFPHGLQGGHGLPETCGIKATSSCTSCGESAPPYTAGPLWSCLQAMPLSLCLLACLSRSLRLSSCLYPPVHFAEIVCAEPCGASRCQCYIRAAALLRLQVRCFPHLEAPRIK